ncbi:DUF4314 domain-containing protein [Staphylococcus gallinarum]|uniref:DUF4314 domain-containing protein n=1 Tax=Staphylococcus gallinarum TaxID=1293 RepID=UPI001E33A754|nr:DUF4314 domain-containing protein [Staphylococcus gallinarum]MCD8845206.1 DUF4314 domain-containing protein [Staphylococcus gallinarum]
MSQQQIELLKKHYKEGERIKLISINDIYTKLTYGDKGTINNIDDIGQIHVDWDCGLSLALNYEEDEFITLEKE